MRHHASVRPRGRRTSPGNAAYQRYRRNDDIDDPSHEFLLYTTFTLNAKGTPAIETCDGIERDRSARSKSGYSSRQRKEFYDSNKGSYMIGDSAMASVASKFDYLPVSLFGAVMGLTGLSVAWRLAYVRYGVPDVIADTIGALAIAAFLAMAAAYTVKWLTAPDVVKAEFRHPIAGNLFGTIFVSLLLLPIILATATLWAARLLWGVGAVGMAVFSWVIISRWMSDRQQFAHATPAWIVPVIGLLDIPLAVPALQFESLRGVMVFGLAVGLFFTTPLFTLIFQRLLFEPPMPEALRPTLLILVAPFSVGYSSYVATTGHTDLFAQSLYILTLFMLSVLLGQLRNLPLCCPFRVSWWSVSFPLAASAIAALKFSAVSPGWATNSIAVGLLLFATAVIGGLLARTVIGIVRGELRALSA
jgi:tellurite resistance protein